MNVTKEDIANMAIMNEILASTPYGNLSMPKMPNTKPTRNVPFLATPKVQGRNEKCACGSGKKYKHCCGKPVNYVHCKCGRYVPDGEKLCGYCEGEVEGE